MSSHQNNSSNTSGGGGGGGGTNPRGLSGRHGNARRSGRSGGNGGSGSRGETARTSPRRDSAAAMAAARHAKPRAEAASAVTAAEATTAATSTTAKPSTHSKRRNSVSREARPSARRRHGKEPSAAPTAPAPTPVEERAEAAATATHTPATAHAAATATRATATTSQPSDASARGLNVSSPAFIPYKYLQQQQQQQQQCGGSALNDDAASTLDLLTFSTATSPLLYTLGSTGGGGSSFSSPLAVAASPNTLARAAALPTVSPLPPAAITTTKAVEPHATVTSFATAVTGGNTTATATAAAAAAAAAPQTSHQLRGAYARATAAAAAAAASATATVPSPAATTPLMQPQHPATTVSSAVPTPRPQSLSQPQRRPAREASRGTSVSTITTAAATTTTTTTTNTPAPVYGPSVPVFHPQFIDVTTGTTSMTPLALLQDAAVANSAAAAAAAAEDEADTGSVGGRTTATTSPPPRPVPLQQPRAQVDEAVAAYGAAPPRPASALTATSHAVQHRVSATTAAALANQDAQLMRRSALQLDVTAPSRTSVAPTPRQLSSVPAAVTAATDAHVVEANSHETPKHRSSQIAGATYTAAAAAAAAAAMTASRGTAMRQGCGSVASTAERLHACLASTEERTEESWGRTGSVMGLTGPRGRSRPHGARIDGYDENDEDDLCDGHRSDTVTPTPTPAKVLAVEGSPFIAAAAADVSYRSGPHARDRSPSHDAHIKPATTTIATAAAASARTAVSASGSGAAQSQNANLQRAMLQLIAQIQANSGSNAGRLNAPSASTNMTNTTNAVTPQKLTGHGAVDAANAVTPRTHMTPDGERVPSARPSATKSAASRLITTIIHTPNASASTHQSGAAAVGAAAAAAAAAAAGGRSGMRVEAQTKGAQRSLASCLEAIATPSRVEPGCNTFTDPAVQSRGFEKSPAPQPRPSSPESSTSHATGPMPVPRSQRRTPRSMTAAPTPSAADAAVAAAAPITVNPNSEAAAVCGGPLPSNTARAAAEAHGSLTSPETRYAVMLEGHMSRRVTAMSATPLTSGVCVLFEEDRGIDMGRVVQCDPLTGAEAAAAITTLASATSPLSRKDRPAPVLRPATAEEEYRWLYADVREAEGTLEPFREAAARLGLPVKVAAAVYQFNRAKLTFYYESSTRVDFRPLLPSLFSRFHCRIWMERMETPEMTGGADDAAYSVAATQMRV